MRVIRSVMIFVILILSIHSQGQARRWMPSLSRLKDKVKKAVDSKVRKPIKELLAKGKKTKAGKIIFGSSAQSTGGEREVHEIEAEVKKLYWANNFELFKELAQAQQVSQRKAIEVLCTHLEKRFKGEKTLIIPFAVELSDEHEKLTSATTELFRSLEKENKKKPNDKDFRQKVQACITICSGLKKQVEDLMVLIDNLLTGRYNL